MKIIVFGVGKYYRNRKNKLNGNLEVIAYLDNNHNLWGEIIDGIKIHAPSDIYEFSYDAIVLMSLKAYEMRQQLLEMAVAEEKIFYFDKFYGYIHKGEIEYYPSSEVISKMDDKLAIITTKMDYNGGSLAAIYAAIALKKQNFSVNIVAPDISQSFMEEMRNKGINFIIYKNLPYAKREELEFLEDFKYIICNTFQMIHCVKDINLKRRIVWWVHEYRNLFDNVAKEFSSIGVQDFFNTSIYAVGNRCRDIFIEIYPQVEVKVMPLGIPDVSKQQITKTGNKVIFAIIGGVSQLKSQAVFLEAECRLTKEEKESAEFWIIGNISDSSYADKVKKMADNENAVKLLGIKSRSEMEQLYSMIDVVVCASKEETGPIVVMEGMMYGKVCITTDTTEMATYIRDGENGFVYETQNAEVLCEKMKWVINHRAALSRIGDAARKVYEDNFTIDKLGKRLQECLLTMDRQ